MFRKEPNYIYTVLYSIIVIHAYTPNIYWTSFLFKNSVEHTDQVPFFPTRERRVLMRSFAHAQSVLVVYCELFVTSIPPISFSYHPIHQLVPYTYLFPYLMCYEHSILFRVLMIYLMMRKYEYPLAGLCGNTHTGDIYYIIYFITHKLLTTKYIYSLFRW